MKNFIQLSLVATIIAITFFSCSKDSDGVMSNQPKSEITLNGKSFPIINANIIGVSRGEDGHSGISLMSKSGDKVKTLTISVPTFTRKTIANTYSFPKTGNNLLLGDYLTNYTYFENDKVVSNSLKTGTVIIKHNQNDNFSVTVDLVMKNNDKFKGTYSGDFRIIFNNN